MVKLKRIKLLQAIFKTPSTKSRGLLPMLSIVFMVISFCGLPVITSGEAARHSTDVTRPKSNGALSALRQAKRLDIGPNEDDPMEPCYLANNRASETLTISESTPVGTVVGEIMVIGDLESIELSIRMPAGNGGSHTNAADDFLMVSGRQQATGTQRIRNSTNGYNLSDGDLARRSGSSRNSHGLSTSLDQTGPVDGERQRVQLGPKTTRDLSEKIDLMPPLSLEQGTKKLILAKKLDRENLDKYAQSSANLLSQSSSASLTVHIKCQLKSRPSNDEAPVEGQQTPPLESQKAAVNRTNDLARSTTPRTPVVTAPNQRLSKGKVQKTNSILIPVHLIITDENDNWPSFSAGPYIIDLNETAQVGSLLQNNEILAYDNDQPGPLSTIEYSILQGSFWSESFGFLNPLDSRSLIVKDNRLLDYESQPKITLKVMARDQGDPPNWAITSLYVNLLDQDDMNPVFNEDKYLGVVRDNRPGEKIDISPRRMVAYDGDKTLSAPISYSFHLKTNHSIHFDLDPDLGQLTLRKTLSEIPDSSISNQPFCLLIKATQIDNPRRWSLTSVSIRMGNARMGALRAGDASDQVLSFAQSNYTVEVSEAASPGSTILVVRTNHKHGVTYQLLDNELGYFGIDQNTGRLTLNKSPDYEMFRHLTVRILATAEIADALEDYIRANRSNPLLTTTTTTTYPRLACDITRVNVKVLNFNDYAPEFSHEQYNFQLSISDLIANFEPELNRIDQDPFGDQTRHYDNKLAHGFGEIELGEEPLDELDQKAILLGQVYCADRDHGDKISLHLTGSRASLFHLSQDGRLYLPLMNATNLLGSKRQSSQQAELTSSSKWGTKATRPVNNQFVMNRIFASARRSDDQQRTMLDRSHLNYLLSELSNLGRLRLKVHATDSGQPDAKQSTALIVISIISIDNFIIQKSPNSVLGGHDGELIQLSNDTSYQTVAKNGNEAPSTPDKGYPTQLMMIPSMNGRSFVHINPDIIGNLLSPSANANSNSSKFDTGDRAKAQPFDILESSASNTVSNSVDFKETNSPSVSNKFQPPGLLLVDDEGAKFVAMPTALEVYNQQVQEAADQQARQRSRHLSDSADKKSSWFHLGDNLGLHSDSALMRWVNLSTAIALHLIVIACILSLVTRVRSMISRSEHQPRIESNTIESNLDRGNRWPRRISNLGSFFADKQSDSVTDILNQRHLSSTYDHTSNGYGAQVEHRVSRLHDHHQMHQHNHDQSLDSTGTSSNQHEQCQREHSIVRSGVVVSARSVGTPGRAVDGGELSCEAKNQQNLFEHLKLTLNKMLDSSKDGAPPGNMGQISFRPLDSDVVNYEDQRDRQLEVHALMKETTDSKLLNHQNNVGPRSPISTFVGTNHRLTTAKQEMVDGGGSVKTRGSKQASTVVSINVSAPKNHQESNSSGVSKLSNLGSSNSSVVSLVSASSSLSNKISQAVSRIESVRNDGSDSTSLNSSILLQGFAGSSSSTASNNKATGQQRIAGPSKLPPIPPPLPPPPSLVRASIKDGQRSFYSNQMKTPNLASHQSGSKATRSLTESALRQAPPENPTHLRLRQDAINDHVVTHNSNFVAQEHSPTNNNKDSKPANSLQQLGRNRSSRSNSAVSGRREIRNSQNIVAHLEQQHLQHAPPARTQQLAPSDRVAPSSNKTVSPTTSVDRGYESFQSSGYQPIGRQFSSLQECPQSCADANCEQFIATMQDHNITRRNRTTRFDEWPGFNQLEAPAYKGRPPRMASRLPSSRSLVRDKAHLSRGSEMREFVVGSRPDCDTEDDDFYYYCNESVHADEHQIGCLSYDNHAYNQQASFCQPVGQPTKSAGCLNKRTQSRRAHQSKHSMDLMQPPSDQLGTNSQSCDTTRGRRHQQNQNRPRHMSGQTSQLPNEMGVKRLTWSDQVS